MISVIKDGCELLDLVAEVFEHRPWSKFVQAIANLVSSLGLTIMFFVQKQAWETANRAKYNALVEKE